MVDKLIYNINIIRNKLSGRFVVPLQEIYKKLMRVDDIRKSNINDKLKNKNIEAYEVNSTAVANYEKFVIAAVKDIDDATKNITVDGMLRTLYFPKKNITESFMEETVNELSHKLNVTDILGNTTLNEYKNKGNLILSDREVLIPGSKYKFKSYKIEKNNNIFTTIFFIYSSFYIYVFIYDYINVLYVFYSVSLKYLSILKLTPTSENGFSPKYSNPEYIILETHKGIISYPVINASVG